MTSNAVFAPKWDTQQQTKREFRRFGYTDNKGREFGAYAHLGTIETEQAPANWPFAFQYRTIKSAGRHFYYVPSAARDGKPFGAGQQVQFFETEAERDAAVERYFAGAEKRAASNKARR